MTLSPRRILGWLSMLGIAVSLVSCCFDCFPPINENHINLAFSTDSLSRTGFRRAELRSVYVVRYNQSGFQGVIDTTRQLPSGLPATGDSSVHHLNLYPDPTTAITNLSLYTPPGGPLSYRIFMPATGRVYELDNISRAYEDPTSGCNCRYVKEKYFTLNGQQQIQKVNGPESFITLYR